MNKDGPAESIAREVCLWDDFSRTCRLSSAGSAIPRARLRFPNKIAGYLAWIVLAGRRSSSADREQNRGGDNQEAPSMSVVPPPQPGRANSSQGRGTGETLPIC